MTKKITILLLLSIYLGINIGHSQTNCIEELSTINVSPAFDIGIKDRILYINPGSSNIKIYNLTDPNNPVFVGQMDYSHPFTEKLDICENSLYLYGGPQNDLLIFDITNPIAPVELSTLPLPASNTGIWNSAHLTSYTYMTAADTLYVINTTDKNAPFIENRILYSNAGSLGLRDVFATSEVLYIGIENGVLIYDNSNQALPVFQSFIENGHVNLAVDTINHRLYTAQEWNSNNTHSMFNINDPFNPDLIFQGYGGSSPSGKLLVNDEALIQRGANNGNQAVSFYKIQGDSTIFIDDFLGSMDFGITDMVAVDSLYIISKFGGIEVLKYNGCTITATNNQIMDNNVQIYPNPIQNILTIEINNEYKDVFLKILDAYGRTVHIQENLTEIEKIDFQNFKNGLYFIVFIQNGNIIQSKKVIKE